MKRALFQYTKFGAGRLDEETETEVVHVENVEQVPDREDIGKSNSQKHGLTLERLYGEKVLKLTKEAIDSRSPSAAIDYMVDGLNISVKTKMIGNFKNPKYTVKKEIMMADAKNAYHYCASGEPFRQDIICYNQINPNQKQCTELIQLDLTNSIQDLFGGLGWGAIEPIYESFKRFNKEKTPFEKIDIQSIDTEIKHINAAIDNHAKQNGHNTRPVIHLRRMIYEKERDYRLQCCIVNFHDFIKCFPNRVVYRGTNGDRGDDIRTIVIESGNLSRKKKL